MTQDRVEEIDGRLWLLTDERPRFLFSVRNGHRPVVVETLCDGPHNRDGSDVEAMSITQAMSATSLLHDIGCDEGTVRRSYVVEGEPEAVIGEFTTAPHSDTPSAPVHFRTPVREADE